MSWEAWGEPPEPFEWTSASCEVGEHEDCAGDYDEDDEQPARQCDCECHIKPHAVCDCDAVIEG